MSELPPGWDGVTLGELTSATRPICYGVLKPGPYVQEGVPLLRIQDLAGNEISTEEVHLISEQLDDEFERSRLDGEEVLLSIQGTIGRTAIVPTSLRGANISRTLAVIAPDRRLDRRLLYYYLQYLALVGGYETGGSTRASLNIGTIRSMTVPVPPVREQERIVAAIEEHLSRLDAADGALVAAQERLDRLGWRSLRQVLGQEEDWPEVRVAEVAELSLGKMLDKKQQTGLHSTPYLRNINVRWGSFELEDLAAMDVKPSELERVTVRDGDVVMCEGGEPGRCAVWRDAQPIAIQKALHRIRPRESVLPDFLVLNFMQMARSGELGRHFTGTTIRHLPKERLAEIRFRLPSTSVQAEAVERAGAAQSASGRLASGLAHARRRGLALRRSILAAAFSGRLVPQDPADEPASALLAHIRAEREAAASTKRTRKAKAS